MSAKFVYLCGTAFVLTISTPALAQGETGAGEVSAPDSAGGVSEIVVTAQKRAENVQDVPIAISTFGGDALRERSGHRAPCSGATRSAVRSAW